MNNPGLLIRRYLYPLRYTVRLVDGGPLSAPLRVVSTTKEDSHGVPLAGCNHIVWITLCVSQRPSSGFWYG